MHALDTKRFGGLRRRRAGMFVDAIQSIDGTEKQRSVGNGRTRPSLLIDHVGPQQLEFGTSLNDESRPATIETVNAITRCPGRRPKGSRASNSLAICGFAGFGI